MMGEHKKTVVAVAGLLWSIAAVFKQPRAVISEGRGMFSSEVLIKARGLTKKFGNFTAVNRIDFEVNKGECVGFLGPNGAGKTTTVRMIYCFLPLTEGELAVGGMSVTAQAREIKRIIGVAPQEDNLDPDFTVVKNLLVYARYFDIQKAEAEKRAVELLRFFQLEEKRDVVISELSTGMKRRLILARALINEPQILLLDEPTTGLDPQARRTVWEGVRALRRRGVTIILTTHYMDEAASLCDRLLIMDNSRIIEQGAPVELVKRHVGEDVLEMDNDENLLRALKKEFPSARFEVFGDRVHVFTDQPHGVFENFLAKFPSKNVTIRNANLEDVFLKLTGKGLRD
ncbi:MAG: ATP-binding cassette domain-containing protein [Candidatus Bathyarchaeota archaeon]|nr:ATP-binding cassette domain-containing protein [Candidatus Bathyarchaeota archaeon]